MADDSRGPPTIQLRLDPTGPISIGPPTNQLRQDLASPIPVGSNNSPGEPQGVTTDVNTDIYRLSASVSRSRFTSPDLPTATVVLDSSQETPTEPDAPINISSSSESMVYPTATKKQKATPAPCALVATSENVRLHNAAQAVNSSSSDISFISSAARQRRYETERANIEVAERQFEQAQAANEQATAAT